MLLSDEEEDDLSARSESCDLIFDRERRLLLWDTLNRLS